MPSHRPDLAMRGTPAKCPVIAAAVMTTAIAMIAAWLVWHRVTPPIADSVAFSARGTVAEIETPADREPPRNGIAHPREDLDDEIGRAAADPTHLRKLLDRYRRFTDADAKRELLIVLSAVANDDVRDVALELASSEDTQKRSDGIELLQSFSLQDTRVRRHALFAIAAERDPALRSHLLGLFDPAPMPSEDAERIERLLVTYSRDADAGMRAQALRKLARWNDSETLATAIFAGLNDPDPAVRQAAIDTSQNANPQNDRIAASLMAIAADRGRPDEERSTAMAALGRFALDSSMQADYDAIRAASAQ
jgi:hypothetical protein